MSITRRTFFRNAIWGASALPGWISSSEQLRRPQLRIDRIVFDARRPHALEFADTARGMGVSTHAVCGDVADRALEDLCARRRTRSTAVAGITDFRSLFLLQAMAADAGMRAVLRIHHRASRVPAAHDAFGAPTYRTWADACLADSGEGWASAAARLVLSLPPSAAAAPRQTGNLDAADQHALGSRDLVTWVMAGP
jgi:hypothetical protein